MSLLVPCQYNVPLFHPIFPFPFVKRAYRMFCQHKVSIYSSQRRGKNSHSIIGKHVTQAMLLPICETDSPPSSFQGVGCQSVFFSIHAKPAPFPPFRYISKFPINVRNTSIIHYVHTSPMKCIGCISQRKTSQCLNFMIFNSRNASLPVLSQ